MNAYMGNLAIILEQCQRAADGKLSADEQTALALRIKGVFMSMPMFGSVIRAAEGRQWHVVEGALANYIDVQEASGNATNITQNATAMASATATASAYADAVVGIESLDSISDEDKVELEKLMLEVKSAKEESVLKHAAKTLVDKAIEKGIDTLPYALPVIIQAAQGMI